eukprot:bmy_22476T0
MHRGLRSGDTGFCLAIAIELQSPGGRFLQQECNRHVQPTDLGSQKRQPTLKPFQPKRKMLSTAGLNQGTRTQEAVPLEDVRAALTAFNTSRIQQCPSQTFPSL